MRHKAGSEEYPSHYLEEIMRSTYDFEMIEARASRDFLFRKLPGLYDQAMSNAMTLRLHPPPYLQAMARELVHHPNLKVRILGLSSLLRLDPLSSLVWITEDNVEAFMDEVEDVIDRADRGFLMARLGLAKGLESVLVNHAELCKEYVLGRNYPELSVVNYLEEVEMMKPGPGHRRRFLRGPEHAPAMARSAKVMKNAKIFDIDPAIYEQAKDLLFHRTMQELDVDEDLTDPKYEANHLMTMIHEWAVDAPMPEERPFENVYLAYRAGVPLDPLDVKTYFVANNMPETAFLDTFRLMGHLISDRGEVWTILRGHLQGADHDVFGWGHVISYDRSYTGDWVNGITMVPWTVPTLLELIEEYKTVMLEPMRVSKPVQKGVKKVKGAKAWSHTPQPYYHIKLKASTIRHKILGPPTGEPFHLDYRHDVRGHYRYRVKRGPLPLSGTDREKLAYTTPAGNKYEIFESGDLPEDIQVELRRRSLPLRRKDEWVAVMKIRIDQYVKGPEDAPYIPALRILDLHELPGKLG